MRAVIPGILTIISIYSFDAQADTKEENLKMLTNTAVEICGEFFTGGKFNTSYNKIAAEAKVSGLLERLADIGADVSRITTSEDYVGVLRSEVSSQLDSVRECRMKIYDDFKEVVIRGESGKSSSNTVINGNGNANVNGNSNNVNTSQ